MNTIKKTTLIAVITAMAAIAVPSMASAATWKPINTNKTLTNVFPVEYLSGNLSVSCTNSTLGVHVRTPASSTLDITSASFTSCTGAPGGGNPCGAAYITATGLPWTATTSGSNVTITEHLQVTAPFCYPGSTFTIDGPVTGSYNNSTHRLLVQPTSPMGLYYMGTWAGAISTNWPHQYHETTDTLVLT
jgi:hypothetical protein